MNITLTPHASGIQVVVLEGEIDSNTAPTVQAQLMPLLQPDARIVLDLQQVTFLSSAGLRVLLLVYRHATAQVAKLVLAGLRDPIRDTMDITGFLQFFKVLPDVDSAIQALSEG